MRWIALRDPMLLSCSLTVRLGLRLLDSALLTYCAVLFSVPLNSTYTPQYMTVHSIHKTVKQILPGRTGKWLGEQITEVGERSLFGYPDHPACDRFLVAVITN